MTSSFDNLLLSEETIKKCSDEIEGSISYLFESLKDITKNTIELFVYKELTDDSKDIILTNTYSKMNEKEIKMFFPDVDVKTFFSEKNIYYPNIEGDLTFDDIEPNSICILDEIQIIGHFGELCRMCYISKNKLPTYPVLLSKCSKRLIDFCLISCFRNSLNIILKKKEINKDSNNIIESISSYTFESVIESVKNPNNNKIHMDIIYVKVPNEICSQLALINNTVINNLYLNISISFVLDQLKDYINTKNTDLKVLILNISKILTNFTTISKFEFVPPNLNYEMIVEDIIPFSNNFDIVVCSVLKNIKEELEKDPDKRKLKNSMFKIFLISKFSKE